MSDQRDKRSAILVMTLSTKPIEFKTAKRTKLKTKAGSSGGDLELSSLVFVFNQMIALTAIITGASMLTLISLTVVATSPVCLDTALSLRSVMFAMYINALNGVKYRIIAYLLIPR